LPVADLGGTQVVFYFDVLSPPSLRYTYEIMMARNIGTPFRQTYKDVRMVYARPADACTDELDNWHETVGAVVMVERGCVCALYTRIHHVHSECSFAAKALTVEASGGVAVIVTHSHTQNDDEIVEMVADTTETRRVNIPAAFLNGKDG
jgi:hypothetical protein